MGNVIQKYQLPGVRETGLTLSVNITEGGDLNIAIEHTRDIQSNPYLVVHTRGIIKKILPIDLNLAKNINIYASELAEGISHLTLLSNDFTPLCERLVFKYPENTDIVSLKLDNQEYQKREKIDLTLGWDQQPKEDDLAHFSISVSRATNSGEDNSNIVSNLLLTSDIKGSIPDPRMFFDPGNRVKARQLDLIMLTNGWRRFDWNAVKMDQNINIKHPAEINAPILSGQG